VSWSAAIGAGLFADSVLLVALVMLSVVIYDESPWKILRMMAAIVRGESALAPGGAFDLELVAIGVLMHFALSLLYAFALAGVLVDFRRWFAPWVGLLFGVALYFANFHGFTRMFGWFAELRTPDTLLAHALFGLLLARAYCTLAATSSKSSR
jgi:hypothetical protein